MPESDLILIDEYLNGLMPESAKKKFEERLKYDAPLRNRLKIIKGTSEAVLMDTEVFEEVLSGVASQYHSEINSSKKKPTTKLISIFSIAAAILLVIIAGSYFRSNFFDTSDPQKLFTKNFDRYPNNITVRGGVELNRPTQEQALYFYMRSLDEEAIALFETLLSSNPTDTVHFFCGVSYLSTQSVDAAIEQFQEVAKFEESIYSIPAQWYLALAYLKIENVDQSKKNLRNLKEQSIDEVYSEKAKELLMKLE